MLVKTTRAKEEERARNQLGAILNPRNPHSSQPTLRYQRAFQSVSADSSLSDTSISMYNTENKDVKHIYTTNSLITHRYAQSPYVRKGGGYVKQGGNFLDSIEDKKFRSMLSRDVMMN